MNLQDAERILVLETKVAQLENVIVELGLAEQYNKKIEEKKK